ncbi:hypothetical protein ACSNOI_21605 [Actinomadura kijaniata]|uniref:hypothetical protein n=1 Tax=Actinomadura kijaniata TaxID=46161 RepID=UPI003F19F03B
MPRVEEAQRTPRRDRLSRDPGVDAGQGVPAVVQGAQDVGRVPQVAVADEVALGALVGVQGAFVVRQQFGVRAVPRRDERVPRQRLAERGDLGVDRRQLVRALPSEEPPQHAHADRYIRTGGFRRSGSVR